MQFKPSSILETLQLGNPISDRLIKGGVVIVKNRVGLTVSDKAVEKIIFFSNCYTVINEMSTNENVPRKINFPNMLHHVCPCIIIQVEFLFLWYLSGVSRFLEFEKSRSTANNSSDSNLSRFSDNRTCVIKHVSNSMRSMGIDQVARRHSKVNIYGVECVSPPSLLLHDSVRNVFTGQF